MKKTFSRVLSALMVCVLVTAMVIGTVSLNTSHAESATFGQCGMNLWWYYDEYTGTLSIKGGGALWDYDLPELTPWWGFAGNIQRIVFSSGVTVIGKNAFAKCAVETIELPDTLTTIKEGAFKDCAKLVEVDASETQLTTIEAKAFAGCQSLPEEAVSLPETIVQVSDTAFDEVMAEPVKPEQPTVAPTEPTEVPTEPTVAPTEPTVEPTDPTVAPTEPTVAPTEPTVAPTEPTVAPTEPTVAPTEPTVAPTEPTAPSEPVVETKTYTTRDHFNVTETWVDGVLTKTVSVSPTGSYTTVSTDYDANAKPGTITSLNEDGSIDTVGVCAYDADGRPLSFKYTDAEGTVVQETLFNYTSATTGKVSTKYGDGSTSTGTVTLHANGEPAVWDEISSDGFRYVLETDEDGIATKHTAYFVDGTSQVSYFGSDGAPKFRELYNENSKLVGTIECESNDKGVVIKEVFTAAADSGNPMRSETTYYDDNGSMQKIIRVNIDGQTTVTQYQNGKRVSEVVTDKNGETIRTTSITGEKDGLTEYTTILADGAKIITRDDESGNQVYEIYYGSNGYQHETFYKDGRPISSKESHPNGWSFTNKYTWNADGSYIIDSIDQDGRTTISVFDQDDMKVSEERYDAQGKLISTTTYAENNDGTIEGTAIYPDGSKSVLTYKDGGLISEVVYDSNGNLFREHSYDENGRPTSWKEFDDTGKLVQSGKTTWNSDGSFKEETFDGEGNLIHTTVKNSDGSFEETKISPDGSKSVQTYKDGRLISEVVTDKNGETISATSITGEKDGITEYTTLHADGGKYIVRSDENGKKVFEGSYGSDGYLRETVYKDGRPDSSIESYPNGWSFTNQYTWNADGSHTIDSIAQDGYTTIYVFDQDDMKVSEECYDPQGGLISSTTYKKNSDGTIEGTMYRNGKKYIQTYKDDILISRDEYNSDGIIIREQTFDENGRQTSWKTYDATGKPEGSGKTTWNSDGSYENMVFDAEGKINYVDQFVMLENGGRIYQRADTAGEKSYSCYDENGRETKHVRIGADGSLLIDNGDDGETASVSADGKWISISGQQNGDSYYFTYQFNEETGEWEENLYSGTGVFDEETGTKAGISEYAPFGDNKLLEEAKSLVTIEIPTTYEAAEETTEEETEETTTEEETEATTEEETEATTEEETEETTTEEETEETTTEEETEETTTEEETKETTTEEETEETTTEEETEETTTEEKTEGTVTTETPVAETEQAA